MRLSAAGEMVSSWWRRLPDKFSSTSVDAYVVMPNHFHGIIVIEASGQTRRSAPMEPEGIVGADLCVRPDRPDVAEVRPAMRVRPNVPLSQMVQWFKTMTTSAYIHGVGASGLTPFKGRLRQRSYHEHIIRNAADYDRIFDYIESNEWRWAEDEENPAKG